MAFLNDHTRTSVKNQFSRIRYHSCKVLLIPEDSADAVLTLRCPDCTNSQIRNLLSQRTSRRIPPYYDNIRRSLIPDDDQVTRFVDLERPGIRSTR